MQPASSGPTSDASLLALSAPASPPASAVPTSDGCVPMSVPPPSTVLASIVPASASPLALGCAAQPTLTKSKIVTAWIRRGVEA
jgi:hypothetical protein